MKFLIYLFFRFVITLFSITPFRVLYLFSSFFSFLLFYVIKYRKDVVFNNLRYAFPDWNEAKISDTAYRFYWHLSDITLESIKGFSMKKNQLIKRYKVLNPEIFNVYTGNSNNAICLASHYCNWEWGILATAFQININLLSLYKPLSNKYIEAYLQKRRSVSGMKMVSIYDTKKSFEENSNTFSAYIMAADQCPTNMEKAIWVDFFNRQTACLHGAEYYAHKLQMPIFYFDVKKTRRGFYTLTITKISDPESGLKPGELTSKYMKMLEQNIIAEPAFWLWSHKRWKNKR